MAEQTFEIGGAENLEVPQNQTLTEVTVSFVDETPTDIKGLDLEEMSDPNAIKVTISDNETPIIVLFGPPACGKTMTLIRLTRFLNTRGYSVFPEPNFRPKKDKHYEKMCNNFNQMVNSDDAQTTTNLISFMLVKIAKDGKPICQILEAPGEFYFSPTEPKRKFPTYVHKIISSNNRKIWVLNVEPAWEDEEDRLNYVLRIKDLKTKMLPKDKVVFLYNKIDLTDFVVGPGVIREDLAIKDMKYKYKGILTPFVNTHPISRFWRPYNCTFVPFQTGEYSDKMDGGSVYTPSHDNYPAKLWNTLMDLIKG